MPWQDVPDFVAKLRQRSAPAARALELCILTWTRTSEILGARWEEFEFERSTWTVPAIRMKSGRDHTIPLCPRALEILAGLPRDNFLFGGKKPLSQMSMMMLMRRMGEGSYTVHGFRSSARDFASDATHHPRDVAEMALAHAIGNDVEAAYRRNTAVAKRRALLADWEGWLSGTYSPAIGIE